MARALLDTSVLIALCDPSHAMHAITIAWLDHTTAVTNTGIATCPIVENGAVRILSQPKYSASLPIGTPSAIHAVRQIRNVRGHAFWSDDVSVLDERAFDAPLLVGPSQITDAYLLALAVAHGGQLATLDTRLMIAAARGATRSHLITIR